MKELKCLYSKNKSLSTFVAYYLDRVVGYTKDLNEDGEIGRFYGGTAKLINRVIEI